MLFRTVINGESTESVAEGHSCTSRNIRDIRSRAIWHLQKKVGVRRRRAEGYLPTTRRGWIILIILMLAAEALLIIVPSKQIFPSESSSTLPDGVSIAMLVAALAAYWIWSRCGQSGSFAVTGPI